MVEAVDVIATTTEEVAGRLWIVDIRKVAKSLKKVIETMYYSGRVDNKIADYSNLTRFMHIKLFKALRIKSYHGNATSGACISWSG